MLSASLIVLLLVVLVHESTEEAAPSHNLRRFMTVAYRRVKIEHSQGRLGNKMREWASAMGVAHHNKGMSLCSLKDNGLSEYFQGPFPVCSDKHINEKEDYQSNADDVTGLVLDADDGRDIHLGGYLSNCKNFADIHDEVAQTFTLLDEHKEAAVDFLESHKGKTKVGIHVRQGDKAHDKHFASEHLPTSQYFADAIAMVRRELEETEPGSSLAFFIASDDIDWCKEQEVFQSEDIHFIEGGSTISDFSILLQMDHFVTSDGTFGWWAAWLGAWHRGGNVFHTGKMDADRWCDDIKIPRWIAVNGPDNCKYFLAGA